MSPEFERRRGAAVFSAPVRPYRMCARCVMDTSDPEIEFDPRGWCNHCLIYDRAVAAYVHRGQDGIRKLDEVVRLIREEGKGKPYDCIIGLSGGVDSTYTAYVVKKHGLRPLAVHLDNGWNSEVAVRNIENIVTRLGIDLHTVVLDWQEFRALQLAFLRASTPDSEIPTDHAIVATLYIEARKRGIGWIVDGSNMVTELMIPPIWSHGHGDWKYIRSVNRQFGTGRLRSFPHYTHFDNQFRIPRIHRIRRLGILNYVDYDKPAAMDVMRRELRWEYYGGKHYESIYTRFYQGYILKEKFGFDKRRSHLSCLVNDGRVTRQQALAELEKPAIEPAQLREDRAFVVKKLGLSEAEFDRIMAAERKTFWDYPSYERDADSTARLSEVFWTSKFVRSMDRLSKLSESLPRSVLRGLHRLWRAPRALAGRVRQKLRSIGG
jgi:N-acetyl sugar amidotransferase